MKRGRFCFLLIAIFLTAFISTGCSKSSSSPAAPAAQGGGGTGGGGAGGKGGAGGAGDTGGGAQATPAMNADISPKDFADILMSQTWCSSIGSFPVSATFNADSTGQIFATYEDDHPDNQNFVWVLQYAPNTAHTTYQLSLSYDDGHQEVLLTGFENYEIKFYSGRSLLLTWKSCVN